MYNSEIHARVVILCSKLHVNFKIVVHLSGFIYLFLIFNQTQNIQMPVTQLITYLSSIVIMTLQKVTGK